MLRHCGYLGIILSYFHEDDCRRASAPLSPISLSSLSFLTVRDMIVPRHPCGRQYVYPPHFSRLLNCTYPFAAFPTPRYASQVARRLGGSWRGADKTYLLRAARARNLPAGNIAPREV